MLFSLIIPAYNEEKRITHKLNELCKYIKNNNLTTNVEVIVVVNNSSDNTASIVTNLKKSNRFIKLIDIKDDIGKGGAIIQGFKVAKGNYIGFVDADRSSSINETFKIFNILYQNSSIDGVIASRHLKTNTQNNRSIQRNLSSKLFNTLVRVLFGLNYKDTQCGLKAFKHDIAKELIGHQTISGWTFDVNLLLTSRQLKHNIVEVQTEWKESKGSKLNIINGISSIFREFTQLKAQQIFKDLQKVIMVFQRKV